MGVFLLRWIALAMVGAGLATPVAKADTTYVLAVSWQPAFCEARLDKPECASQTADRFDASHFTLHGLWPQPRGNEYCSVPSRVRADDESGNWRALPDFGLTVETRRALERAMPGTASFLHRHEWTRHGTCYGESPEAYFSAALRLLDELNASPVRTLFADDVGGVLTGSEIRERFDLAFGPGAGRRVEIACRRVGVRRLIVELRIGLSGPVTADRSLTTLLADAPEVSPGCSSGIVDRVGSALTDR